MKKVLKLCFAILAVTLTNSCNEESINDELLDRNYIYDINDIYTKKSSFKSSVKSNISDITYVIPVLYQGENYNFEITTLTDDGKTFNVFFNDGNETFSINYLIDGDKLLPLDESLNIMSKRNDSFGSCVGSHEGAGYALLTGACAGITSFIPFMQPVAFACAAETAVIASLIAADCATN